MQNGTDVLADVQHHVEDRARQLAARWLDLDADRRRIVDEQDRLKHDLRDLLGEGRHPAGAVEVKVARPARRWSETKARQVLPPDVLAMCTRPVLDRAAVQQAVPPDLYGECQVEGPGDLSVTIK